MKYITKAGLVLPPQDIEVLRYLRKELYSGGPTFIKRDALPRTNCDANEWSEMFERLFNNRLVQRPIEGSRAHLELVEITDQGLVSLHEAEHPDHWASIVRWFRSRPWSIGVLAFAVGLPIIVKWIEMLRTVLGWIVVKK